jgi:hypothetical protein
MCQWRWAMLEQSCMVMMIARDIIWYTWQVRRKSQVAEMSIDANMIMKKIKDLVCDPAKNCQTNMGVHSFLVI